MMVNLQLIGTNLVRMHEIADNGKLFAKRCHPDNILTRAYSEINQEYFYGRFAGFHVSTVTKSHSICIETSRIFDLIFYCFFVDGRAPQKLRAMSYVLNGKLF